MLAKTKVELKKLRKLPGQLRVLDNNQLVKHINRLKFQERGCQTASHEFSPPSVVLPSFYRVETLKSKLTFSILNRPLRVWTNSWHFQGYR